MNVDGFDTLPYLAVGVNGFGRIGRLVVRAAENSENVRVVAINVSYKTLRFGFDASVINLCLC